MTNLAVHYTEVNKLMRTVKLKTHSLDKIKDLDKVKTKISELNNELGLNNSLIKKHKNIESYIDTTYIDFMYSLEKLSPELSDKEKRICSLILINCSSKEIAGIVSNSPKSINNSRSMIRRKLSIPDKENMNEFFNKLIKEK